MSGHALLRKMLNSAGELAYPKGHHVKVYCRLPKVNASLCWSSGWTGIVQKPEAMSNVDRIVEPLIFGISWSNWVIDHLENGTC